MRRNKAKDFAEIKKLLDRLEASLKESTTKFLFSEESYTFLDVALLPQVERLFFFKKSDIGAITNFDFLNDYPCIEKWIKVIRSRAELQKAITDEEDFLRMIRDFVQTGKWGLKYPLAKI